MFRMLHSSYLLKWAVMKFSVVQKLWTIQLVKLARNPLQISHSKLSLAPHL